MKCVVYIVIVCMGSLIACKQSDSDPVLPLKPVTTPTQPVNVLKTLPVDTGGVHTPVALGADGSPYGYYVYKPSGYTSTGAKYPLLIFLHGSGEIGNSEGNVAELKKILDNGPPQMITQKKWSPEYPMLVVSAQCHDSWWDYQKVHQFIEFIRTTYQVDTTRVYMTGFSMGGYGTYDQITVYGKNSHIAAAVTCSGAGTLTSGFALNASKVPLWAFHGEEDTTVLPDFDIAMNREINALKPAVPAKLTLYPGVGHDCWTETYDNAGMGKEDKLYDAFSSDVFSWMFQYKLEK